MKVSEAIAKARKDAGLTQEQLAGRLYVTRQAVSRWETGPYPCQRPQKL